MEGPYRDLGCGFARLLGVEGLRRSPGSLHSVEEALLALLRNARDARALNIYVASSLRARRYRTLVVIDDGHGLPETHKDLIFEPGVTTRHLEPVSYSDQEYPLHQSALHGAGLSLYHIKNAALSAEVLSPSSPTAVKVVFDTRTLPEKSLQSGTRPSKTNLRATIANFARQTSNSPRFYHASPASILARLLKNHIIHQGVSGEGKGETGRLHELARGLGLELSLRTMQRVVAGRVPAANEVVADSLKDTGESTDLPGVGRNGSRGPILSMEAEDLAKIRTVLRSAARSSYLDLAGLEVEKRPGEVLLRARVYEPEEEYE